MLLSSALLSTVKFMQWLGYKEMQREETDPVCHTSISAIPRDASPAPKRGLHLSGSATNAALLSVTAVNVFLYLIQTLRLLQVSSAGIPYELNN